MQVRQKQKIDKLLGYFLISLLWPFTRLLGIILHRNHSLKKPPKKILFIKLLGLGSLIIATEAIAAIKQKFPEAKLILLTDTNIAAGIKPFGLFDEVWETGGRSFLTNSVRAIYYIMKSWRRNLWVIDLEVYSKLTTVLALMTAARNRFGFFLPLVTFRKYLNTHNISFDQSGLLEDNYSNMARAVTGLDAIPCIAQRIRSGESTKKYILFNNTCSGLAYERKLPDHLLLALCEWTLEKTDYDIAFLGMNEDKEDIDRFIKNNPGLFSIPERIVNYAGQAENFTAYYHFLETEGVLLVTIDSGPLHMAKKLGIPTLSLWGPTKPEHYLKIHAFEKERHLTHYLGKHCSPCIHRYEKLPCSGNNICMKNMEAGMIIVQMKRLLAHLEEATQSS